MQTPDKRNIETRVQAAGLVPPESLGRNDLETGAPSPQPYVQEPLFNKKVMAAWAIGAALVWFALSFVLPIAGESARTAIIQAVKEAETNTAVPAPAPQPAVPPSEKAAPRK